MFESGSRVVRRSCRASISRPSLPDKPDGGAAGPVNAVDDLFVDRPGQHHFDNIDGLAIGDPQPVHEFALDLQALEHRADLRATAVHDNRVHADLLEQHDVLRKRERQIVVAHGVPAELDHERLVVEFGHVGQRFCERPCGFSERQGRFVWRRHGALIAQSPAASQFGQAVTECRYPDLLARACRNDVGKGSRMLACLGHDEVLHVSRFLGGQRIDLGQYELEGDAQRRDPRDEVVIVVHQAATRVDQQHDAPQVCAGLEVGLGKAAPRVDLRLGCLRESVTRQVRQQKQAVAFEEVDGLGAARLPRRACEAAPSRQGIEQARLADVGAARQSRFPASSLQESRPVPRPR